MISILLIHDDPLVQRGLAMLLEAQPGYHVERTVAGPERALAKLSDRSYDVVLVDIDSDALFDLVCSRHIQRASPGSLLFLTSNHVDDRRRAMASEVGAVALVLKRPDVYEFVDLIEGRLAGF